MCFLPAYSLCAAGSYGTYDPYGAVRTLRLKAGAVRWAGAKDGVEVLSAGHVGPCTPVKSGFGRHGLEGLQVSYCMSH